MYGQGVSDVVVRQQQQQQQQQQRQQHPLFIHDIGLKQKACLWGRVSSYKLKHN